VINRDRKPDKDLKMYERGTHEKAIDALAVVDEAAPDPGDELPPGYERPGKSTDLNAFPQRPVRDTE
jgi:hypothetical protein